MGLSKEELFDKVFEKSEHLDDKTIARIKKMYTSDPSNHSVRSIAKELGIGRSQVARVVRGLGQKFKTDEQVHNKQSEHARWKGKKLPEHIVSANHEGRNKQIQSRPQTSMEGPVARALRSMGISFKSQVNVEKLLNVDDPEAGIVDFYVASKKTVINADGPRHSLDNVKKRIGRQDSRLRSAGYKVVHITPGDLKNLKEILQNALK